MRSLTDFITSLPGVRPRLARKEILEGSVLSSAERADIHWRASRYGPIAEVGPDAAAVILVAYASGKLPMVRGATPSRAPGAEAYLARRNALVAERDERRRRVLALRDPSLVVESDFSDHAFLDTLFHGHLGKGAGMLRLAGIDVTKSLSGYPTNSGKNRGWVVGFDWVGSDGVRRRSETTPLEAGNRHNDEGRNWGLPE